MKDGILKEKNRVAFCPMITMMMVMMMMMIMMMSSFWIKPEAVPARVTLGVTSLLTLSTQHANSQKSLPPVSYIKVIHPLPGGFYILTEMMIRSPLGGNNYGKIINKSPSRHVDTYFVLH